jgi:hypothetical protein
MPARQLPLPNLAHLKPFRSFLFLKLSGAGNAAIRTNELRDAITDLAAGLRAATVPVRSARSTKGELYSAYAVYRKGRRAAWTIHPDFQDIEHHLLLVSGYRDLFAVFISDASLREVVKTEMAEEAEAFEDYERIPTNKLNAVFVKGRARTLWLNNVQGRTSLKADNKVLSGINLEDALDPLEDQSYAFSAARCQNDVAATNSTYGIAPGRSRLWFKPSRNWNEYTATVMTLLEALHNSNDEKAAPLPVLSVPIQGPFSLHQFGEAYEIGIVPPEVTNPAEEAEQDIPDDEDPELFLDVVDGTVPILLIRVVSEAGADMGQYHFQLQLDSSANVSWAIAPASNGTAEMAAVLSRFVHRINASFDGGFSVSSGRIHSAQYRDLPFTGFIWTTFGQTNILKEKPQPLSHNTIGMQDSLFCWVRTQWSHGALNWLPAGGWLASNDGALEVADFIHLSDGAVPTLTLVHVKAAGSAGAARPLAVTPFEIVVSQAVKNLRHTDPFPAADEFLNRLGRQIQNAVWHNGVPAARQAMLNAIQAHGANLRRRVVIVQPHTRRQAFEQALVAAPGSRERHVVRQLSTLLLGAQQNCSGVGAEFVVVAHEA